MTLIPTNGVHITETPRGYEVSSYDIHGLVSQPRWFATHDQAKAYAAVLKRIRNVDMI